MQKRAQALKDSKGAANAIDNFYNLLNVIQYFALNKILLCDKDCLSGLVKQKQYDKLIQTINDGRINCANLLQKLKQSVQSNNAIAIKTIFEDPARRLFTIFSMDEQRIILAAAVPGADKTQAMRLIDYQLISRW